MQREGFPIVNRELHRIREERIILQLNGIASIGVIRVFICPRRDDFILKIVGDHFLQRNRLKANIVDCVLIIHNCEIHKTVGKIRQIAAACQISIAEQLRPNIIRRFKRRRFFGDAQIVISFHRSVNIIGAAHRDAVQIIIPVEPEADIVAAVNRRIQHGIFVCERRGICPGNPIGQLRHGNPPATIGEEQVIWRADAVSVRQRKKVYSDEVFIVLFNMNLVKLFVAACVINCGQGAAFVESRVFDFPDTCGQSNVCQTLTGPKSPLSYHFHAFGN